MEEMLTGRLTHHVARLEVLHADGTSVLPVLLFTGTELISFQSLAYQDQLLFILCLPDSFYLRLCRLLSHSVQVLLLVLDSTGHHGLFMAVFVVLADTEHCGEARGETQDGHRRCKHCIRWELV